MLYVHVAAAHHRELPEIVREKARGIDDPDQRVLAMLGARGSVELTEVRGSGVAVAAASSERQSGRERTLRDSQRCRWTAERPATRVVGCKQ